MGLGFGFACCCVLVQDDFESAAITSLWQVDAGDWTQDTDLPVYGGSGKSLRTEDANAKITCTETGFDYPYAVQVKVTVKNLNDEDWFYVYLGSLTIRIRCDGVDANHSYAPAELIEDGTTVLEFFVAFDGTAKSLAFDATVYEKKLSIECGPALAYWKWTTADPIGTTIALGTGDLSSGNAVAFDVFRILDADLPDCHEERPDCEGWEDGVLPNHVYADVDFIVPDTNNACGGDSCAGMNGTWELPLVDPESPGTWPGHCNDEPCTFGCRSGDNETDIKRMGYGCVDMPLQWCHHFTYEKEGEDAYRATYVHTIYSGGDVIGCLGDSPPPYARRTIYKATFSKTYTTPAAPGWEDDLPLTELWEESCSGLYPSGLARWHCKPDPGAYGNNVHVWTE